MDNNKKGFTLVELVVVMSIISLLSSIVLANFNGYMATARDAKRISDIKEIEKGLLIYVSNHGTLPAPADYGRGNDGPSYWTNSWDLSSNISSGSFMSFLTTDKIFSTVPVDPINTPAYNGYPYGDPYYNGYRYVYYVDFTAGDYYDGGSCADDIAGAKGAYLLAIPHLETGKTKFQSPGCSCFWKNDPGKNMFNFFDYVICGTF